MADFGELPLTGDEWRALRERRGITLTQLARETGLQVSTIRRLEADGPCSESTRRLVGAALGLRVFTSKLPAGSAA